MWDRPLVQELIGNRLHMQHGPIDLVLKAWGPRREVDTAYRAASARFETVLDELVADLPELRRAMSERPEVRSPVAIRMMRGCLPFTGVYLSPMAAVAGAVADEILASMCADAALDRAFVNNGGDIAVHLAPGQSIKIGVMGDFSQSAMPVASAEIEITAAMGIRGVATSGAQGRSFSLGIADSVTVLAADAAGADAAATLVANAVNIEHPRIVRRHAHDLDPDNELGCRLVTVLVPPLAEAEIAAALQAGLALAGEFRARGLILGAALSLQGRTIALDHLPKLQPGAG